MDILHPGRCGQVVRRAVGVGVLMTAVIALARGVLERGVGIEPVAAVGRRKVERKASAVDRMVGLLGDEGFVRRQVQQVAAPAVFVDVVILRRDARISPRAEKRAHADRLAVDDGQFGETVAVVVVARAVAALTEDADARTAALGDDRGVEHRRIVIGVAAAERSQRVRQLGRTTRRFPGDDVDRAADSRRTEKRRAAAAQHLDPLDHVGRNLLQPVDTRQGRKDGMRIDQNLRIVAVEAVDAHLHEAAVLAVVLDPHAGLERKALRQTRGIGPLEQLGVEHAHQRRSLAPQRRRTARRHDHLVHRDAVLRHLEIQFQRLAALQRDGGPFRGVAQGADFERQLPFGKVFQKIVSRSVGRRTEGRADDGYRGIGNMFVGFTVHHMTVKVGIRAFARGLGAQHAGNSQAHDEEYRQDMSFHSKIKLRVGPGKLRTNQKGGETRLRHRRRPQGEERNLRRTLAARGLGQQHGEHLGVELVRVRDFEQIGEEMEIIDDAELDDLLLGAVVGHQVAAERREVGRVLVIDMHLLPRVGREQDRQQESRTASSESGAHLHRMQSYNKKGPRQAAPAKIPKQ